MRSRKVEPFEPEWLTKLLQAMSTEWFRAAVINAPLVAMADRPFLARCWLTKAITWVSKLEFNVAPQVVVPEPPPALAVGITLRVAVGVNVKVGDGVDVSVGVEVLVGVEVSVAVGLGVKVAVALGVGVAV